MRDIVAKRLREQGRVSGCNSGLVSPGRAWRKRAEQRSFDKNFAIWRSLQRSRRAAA